MTNSNAIHDFRTIYGTVETAGLVNGHDYHEQFHDARHVCWTTPGLRVTRLRLLSDPGFPFWDVSYCHGYVGEEPVHVQLPFSQLRKGSATRSLASQIVGYAITDKVNAKRMGILDAISKLC